MSVFVLKKSEDRHEEGNGQKDKIKILVGYHIGKLNNILDIQIGEVHKRPIANIDSKRIPSPSSNISLTINPSMIMKSESSK